MVKKKKRKLKKRRARRFKTKEDLVEITKSKGITLHVPVPFDNKYKLNEYYFKLTKTLEKDTNRLVFETVKGKIPHSKVSLQEYLGLTRQHLDYVYRKLSHNGILMRVFVYGQEMLYINPAFAFHGNLVPKSLLRMFKYEGDKTIGEFAVEVDKTPYARTKESKEVIKKILKEFEEN